MAMAQGPFLVGTAPPFAPVPNPGVTQPQQPSVNIAVSSQQTVQQPLQQQVQQPAYIQQQPQFVQPVSQPQPTTQPSVNIAVSSQQTTQQVQPPAYQYIQQQPQVVQPVNQVVVVQPNLTDTSRQKMCPNCRNTGMTQLRYINGMLTWLICGVVGIFGFLPYMCIPSCVNSCKDVEHSCPSCGHVLYVHRRT
uniref:lipopolysaccharide-induced tumor necrosis factor-alpha factor homolog n=1 Tax=Gasterosteus aculeatus aculeatus TaxID=481459 RepID=UPI001A99AB97|nr:lipopolysaccharide-induced tumor necrosis factor-alpha factor homolog [Gasterosteus aculeatus aculeatus]